MKIQFWSVGKTHESYVKEGIDLFTKRINHYYAADWKIIAIPKNSSSWSNQKLKAKEGEIILSLLSKDDFLVVLDENGKSFDSMKLANFIQQTINKGIKNVVFLIGGAFGVNEAVLKRANFTWSLSQLVFPHQLVRLILAEQIYRACTILKNEKYHHQ